MDTVLALDSSSLQYVPDHSDSKSALSINTADLILLTRESPAPKNFQGNLEVCYDSKNFIGTG